MDDKLQVSLSKSNSDRLQVGLIPSGSSHKAVLTEQEEFVFKQVAYIGGVKYVIPLKLKDPEKIRLALEHSTALRSCGKLQDRDITSIDLKNLTATSREGEKVLLNADDPHVKEMRKIYADLANSFHIPFTWGEINPAHRGILNGSSALSPPTNRVLMLRQLDPETRIQKMASLSSDGEEGVRDAIIRLDSSIESIMKEIDQRFGENSKEAKRLKDVMASRDSFALTAAAVTVTENQERQNTLNQLQALLESESGDTPMPGWRGLLGFKVPQATNSEKEYLKDIVLLKETNLEAFLQASESLERGPTMGNVDVSIFRTHKAIVENRENALDIFFNDPFIRQVANQGAVLSKYS